MDGCTPLAPGSGFIQSILAFLDCQAWSIGARGWQVLAAPGSTLALVLMGFLTLFVALFGYRLLLGQGPDVRTGVVAFVKIGIVFALATSWGAYSTLVYDVVNRGPTQLAAEIGGASRLPGTGGDLIARLDGADRAFVALAVLGEGRAPPLVTEGNQTGGAFDVPVPPYSGSYALGVSRMLFLTAAIAGLGGIRLIAGLLLAVGPFFIAFLLFENTRSLFEGWVRVLAGAALGALGVSIALAVELALIEPWLSDLLARRSADEWLPGMPIELLVVTFAFALIVLAMLYASAKTAFAFRLAPAWQGMTSLAGRDSAREERRFAAAATARGDSPPAEARSRAATVVDAVAATQRREAANIAVAATQGSGGGREAAAAAAAQPAAAASGGRASPTSLAPAPLGQSFRRTRGRVSASAGRRDHRS